MRSWNGCKYSHTLGELIAAFYGNKKYRRLGYSTDYPNPNRMRGISKEALAYWLLYSRDSYGMRYVYRDWFYHKGKTVKQTPGYQIYPTTVYFDPSQVFKCLEKCGIIPPGEKQRRDAFLKNSSKDRVRIMNSVYSRWWCDDCDADLADAAWYYAEALVVYRQFNKERLLIQRRYKNGQ